MLRELCLDAGDDVLTEIVGSWESEATRHLSAAKEGMKEGDANKVKASAHALKGSCGNMGVARMAELGRQLEAQVTQPAEASAILTEMQAEFDRARALLAKISH